MRKVVLHLGLAKTGTSWLQQQVFPRLPLHFYHCKHYDVLNKNTSNMLLSFEGLSGTIQCNDRYVNAYRLHKLFPKAQVIVVFRGKSSYLHSLYSQFIRGGGTWSFYTFNNWAMRHPYFMDWNLYKAHLRCLFDDVLFLEFEDLKKNPQQFVKELCCFIEVPMPDGIMYDAVNVTLTKRQLERWRKWNVYFKSAWNRDATLPRYCNPCVIYDNLRKVKL